MSDEKVEGGAGPALAAHSKDAATLGSGPAPSNAANDEAHQSSPAASKTDTVTQISGQTREAASKAIDNAPQVLDNASEQVSAFVRNRPIAALMGAGIAGLALGMLLSRR